MKYDFSQWARYPEPANLREWMFQELEFIRSICYQPYGGLPPEKIAPTYFQPQSFRMLWELFCLGGVKLTCVDDDLIMIDPGPNINELWKELNPHKQDPAEKGEDHSPEIPDHAGYEETDYALLASCSTREPRSATALSKELKGRGIYLERRALAKRMGPLEHAELVVKEGQKKGWRLTNKGFAMRVRLAELHA